MVAMAKRKTKAVPTPFGVRLKALRQKAGMSQLELATAVGTNRVSVARFETSPDANPTLDLVHKLCVALGCEIQELAPLPHPPAG